MKTLPHNTLLHHKSQRIMDEVWQYVQARQKPLPPEDPVVLHLKSRLQSSPRDQEALKQWGEHIHKERHRDVFRRLHCFRKLAVTTTGAFFHELCDWPTRPFERSAVSPAPQSALEKLPNFASNHEWDPEAASALLARTFRESPHVSSEVPTWHEFQQSIQAPKKQSGGMDHMPPHLLAHLLAGTSNRYGCRDLSPPPGWIQASPYSTKQGTRVMRATIAPSRSQAACTKFCASYCSSA